MQSTAWTSGRFLTLCALVLGGFSASFSLARANPKPLPQFGYLPTARYADWLQTERTFAENQLLKAISPPDGGRGAVMASPSRSHPNYYFHWVRDAALTMDTFYLFQSSQPERVEGALIDYINFSHKNQLTDNPSGRAMDRGLGEPKFQITGSPFNEGWGRPQNDGPALRALTLMKLANQWLSSGKSAQVSRMLYRSEMPANTLLKADLEYVSHHWNEPNFDVWEETSGMHFYTLLVQMTSLIEGSKLAIVLGDPAAAEFYSSQAHVIEDVLQSFWSDAKGYYVVTTHQNRGLLGKDSGLDAAVILGVLHSKRETGPFSILDPKVLLTAQALESTFRRLYAVNKVFDQNLAPGIGRYPEDTYDGYDTGKVGNPWYLCTLALSEFYFKLSMLTPSSKEALKKAYFDKGEGYLARIQRHVPEDGSLSEQFNRTTGFAQGAVHLTWSYAAFLTTQNARDAAFSRLPQ